MSEWKEVKLGDLVSIKYGKDHKSLSDGCYPVYGSGGLMRKVDSYIYDKPSLLIPRKGTLNNIIYTDDKFWTVDTMFWTKIDEFKTTAKFLYYYLKNFNFNALNVGSAVPSLTVPVLNEIDIKLPPKDLQNQITVILSSLDAKIETNNKLNEKLEEMAQAIFKSWFVDFEPFKNQPFHETELGMIPEGWEVGYFEDIAIIVGGGTPSKQKQEYYTEDGIAWLTPKDLSLVNKKFTSKGAIDITKLGYEKSSAKLMPKGSVLFSSRAPIGYITIAKNEICTNQGFKSAVPQKAGTAFIYYLLKNKTPEIENMATGSTFKEASGTLMKTLKIIIPIQEVLDNFEQKMEPIFRMQSLVEEENDRLASLRDTLLPRLMSGEIKI